MNDDQTARIDVDRTGTFSDLGRDSFERVAEEFAEECRRGVAHSIADYERRHPEHAERIRELLPTVALMEQLKRGTGRNAAEPQPGPMPERLGEFRVIRELGRGGMGTAYEAVQESLGRHVALKVVHNIHLNAKRLQRFRREAQAVAQLHHTNIVPIFGVGEHDGLPYYAMQYIRGSGLDALVAGWKLHRVILDADRWRFAANVGVQAAEALEYAHGQGVLHRDIKPANLLIDEHRTTWITDFGLAKLSGHDDLTASGDVLGTLRYLAPEGLRGEADARSDVYSLGLTLYELLTLNAPFGELSPSELLRHVNESRPVRPRKLAPEIPRDLETIVLKSIAREPAHRYQSAGALAGDLRRFLEDRPIHARRATPVERAWRWGRRNRLAAAMMLTAFAAIVLAAGVGWAGYAMTAKALRRSDDNVALSLEVFGKLFDELAGHDLISTPPLGEAGARRSPGPLVDRRPPGGGGPDDPGPRAKGDRPGPGPGPGPEIFAEGDRPGPRRRGGNQEGDTQLLESVLSFYDRFASRNASDPKLEGEAAWAYRKVGALYERLGREPEALRAYDRAIGMFESLVARYPGVAEYRSKLVQTYDMADPHAADPSSLGRLEAWLRRAKELADPLIVEVPGTHEYEYYRVRVLTKLGIVLRLRGKLDEAEARDREAIAFEGEVIARSPEVAGFRLDRATTREALALVEVDRGRPAEAKALLDEAADDLIFLMDGGRSHPPVDIRLRSLAEAYRKLGESARADEMGRRADQDEATSHRPPPGARGKRPGAPSKGAGR